MCDVGPAAFVTVYKLQHGLDVNRSAWPGESACCIPWLAVNAVRLTLYKQIMVTSAYLNRCLYETSENKEEAMENCIISYPAKQLENENTSSLNALRVLKEKNKRK